MEDVKYLKTLEEIKVFSDSYRYKILDCFYSLNEPATAKRVADEMGEAPAKIHYHVKKMEKVGILNLVYTKVINGITAKYYEPAAHKFNLTTEEEGIPKEKVFNEAKNAIHKLFDGARDSFLTYFDIGKKDVASASMGDLYLTKEKMEELRSYIENYMDENGKKQNENNEGINAYHVFFSIIKKNDKKEN
ncbi:helix-turn-helix transcriptional regulator [Clostridium sp. 19966]|uniref:helix-turn-helix domain-containing protein n=1 Tax=Clostridium sp. 19966 TaxID=2768166 RepID=UPI0028DD9425|nr:helix-turn-helix domain-containing protein [Clostridium sp. 19966]MDT8718555.1 helix-turn-helix transcriptional regulator [Clostridium sp. 19966]